MMFENSTVKDKGRKFYEDLKQEFELLDSRLCDLLHRETIFCKEFLTLSADLKIE